MKKVLIVYFILLICLMGCTKKDVNNPVCKIISVTPNKDFSNSFSTDSIFDNAKYIPLQTLDNCLIGSVDKVIYRDNKLFILDRNEDQVLVFDSEGRFIKKYGNKGKGPGEFLSVDDIAVDDNFCYILARDSEKIVVFSLDGSLKSEMPLDSYFSTMSVVNGKYIVLYRNFSKHKSLMNFCCIDIKSGKTVTNFHQYLKKQSGQGYDNTTLDVYNDLVYYFLENDYFIYKYEDETSNPEYKVDFGKGFSLPEGSQYFNHDEVHVFRDPSMICGINNLMITDNALLFNYVYMGCKSLVVYNKHQNKILANGYLRGSVNIPYLENRFVGKFDDTLIVEIDASIIISGHKYGSKEIIDARKSISSLSNVQLSDNPVIVMVDLKKL